MDFSSRDVQRQPSAAPVAQSSASTNGGSASSHGRRGRSGGRDKAKWMRIGIVTAAVAVVILIGAVITVIVSGSNDVKAESNYVDTGKLQAVFLNTGQVYFGHVQSLNDKYFVLNDIYYLQTSSNGSSTSSSSSASNVTLVKLGCELHRPYDQMVINSSEVTFWENLQSDGQVASAVAKFQQDNPDGLKCTDQSNSASSSSINSAQNAGSSTTPSTTTPSSSSSSAKH